MRLAYGNAHLKPVGNTNGNAYANSDSYGGGFSYTYSDGYSYWHAVTHSDLRTRWHAWTMGYRGARATRSLSCWWMHRWNKHLRVWRW